MDEAVVGDEVSLRNKEDFLQMILQNHPFLVSQHTEVPVPAMVQDLSLYNAQ